MNKIQRYVGFDVHQDTIVIAVAEAGRAGEVRPSSTISSDLHALERDLPKLRADGAELHVACEAGPRKVPDISGSAPPPPRRPFVDRVLPVGAVARSYPSPREIFAGRQKLAGGDCHGRRRAALGRAVGSAVSHEPDGFGGLGSPISTSAT